MPSNQPYKYVVHFPNEHDRSPTIVRTLEEAIDQATWRSDSGRYPGIIDAYHNPTPNIEHVTLKAPTLSRESTPDVIRYATHPLVYLCYRPTPEASPLQDAVLVRLDGTIEGAYSRTPLADLQRTLTDQERPLPCFITVNANSVYEADKYTSDPRPISKDEFWEALECLPPENWHRTPILGCYYSESFRSCEYLTGAITSHYVAIAPDQDGEVTYWSFTAECTSHENAIARVIVARNLQLCKDKQVSV